MVQGRDDLAAHRGASRIWSMSWTPSAACAQCYPSARSPITGDSPGLIIESPRPPHVTIRAGSDALLSSVEAMPEGSTITGEQADLEGSGVPNGRVGEPRACRPRGVAAIASLRDGLAARLERWSGRPTLVAVAAMNA